jgi:hypothetical protein
VAEITLNSPGSEPRPGRAGSPRATAAGRPLPFREAIAFFRQKTPMPSATWTDFWQEKHDSAFVVAGAMRQELVDDFFTTIDRLRSQGKGYGTFLQEFDRIVAQHGWQYNGSRGWRSRVIWRTNMRTSYQAGRYRQMKEVAERRPYWEYHHSDFVADPRPHHVALDGTILPHDHPFWDTHYPPNGWGCQCYVTTHSRQDLEREGRTVSADPQVRWEDVTVGSRGPRPQQIRVPEGIDPGWAYAPGRAWTRALVPEPLDGGVLPASGGSVSARPAWPVPRVAPASKILPAGLEEIEYVRRFLGEFGVGEDDRYTYYSDVLGDLLLISDDLFRGRDGTWKVLKRGRERHILLLADTIKEPDEIWLDEARFGGRSTLRRRYLARWAVEGSEIPAVSVFETGPVGWVGVTAHSIESIGTLERQSRRGRRVYVREEKE